MSCCKMTRFLLLFLLLPAASLFKTNPPAQRRALIESSMAFFHHWSTGILVGKVDCCLYCQCRSNPDQNSLAAPHFMVLCTRFAAWVAGAVFVLEFEQSIRVHWPDLGMAKAWACRLRYGRDFVFAVVFVFSHTCGLLRLRGAREILYVRRLRWMMREKCCSIIHARLALRPRLKNIFITRTLLLVKITLIQQRQLFQLCLGAKWTNDHQTG
jgi:hypothetical protein